MYVIQYVYLPWLSLFSKATAIKRHLSNNLYHLCAHSRTQNQGNTALHYAYAFGFHQLGKYLTMNGADDTLLNNQG